MASEPTSSLTFSDLIIEVARRIGVAYYGAAGDEAVQVPTDAHDLAECKRHVNNAIRMFLNDAPPPGWRFARPTASITIWGDIAADSDNTVSGGAHDAGEDRTLITAESDSFYESMEGKTITIDSVDYTIETYVTAKTVYVAGDASAVSADTWAITSDGNYTLPRTFGGQYTGDITYAADTNQGVSLDWTDEGLIRQWRENVTDETGDPYWAAVRPMASSFDPRRRWELMLYPQPDEVMVVQFPYFLHFDKLVTLTEYPPVPIGHDETIKAACLAVVEKDVENVSGPDRSYYQHCLQGSYRTDSRSAPRRLGYVGNPGPVPGRNVIQTFRQQVYDRPTVTYDTN